MTRTKRRMLLSPLAFAIAFGAYAETPATMEHGNHGATISAPATSSSEAYRQANDAMHANMAVELTGDADVDFIRSMIPHHQGAVDMARIVLAHGKDPEVRKLAESVIAAQEAEIGWMTEWLEQNGQ